MKKFVFKLAVCCAVMAALRYLPDGWREFMAAMAICGGLEVYLVFHKEGML